MSPQLVYVTESVPPWNRQVPVGIFTNEIKMREFIEEFSLNKPAFCINIAHKELPINPSFGDVFEHTKDGVLYKKEP